MSCFETNITTETIVSGYVAKWRTSAIKLSELRKNQNQKAGKCASEVSLISMQVGSSLDS